MPAKNKLTLSVQFADDRLAADLPRPLLRRWVQAALLGPAELTLRFVDESEGRTLNRDYRDKDYATNVLTFAYGETDEVGLQVADKEKAVDTYDLHATVLQLLGLDHLKTTFLNSGRSERPTVVYGKVVKDILT